MAQEPTVELAIFGLQPQVVRQGRAAAGERNKLAQLILVREVYMVLVVLVKELLVLMAWAHKELLL
jgi:hypothetical protein